MATTPFSSVQLENRREQLKAELLRIDNMRPGSLMERYRRCGKANCHCAEAGSRGHGPSYSLTYAVSGKTVTKIIPKGPAVEQTRQQIAEYQRFRTLMSALVAVNQQICDARIKSGTAEETVWKKKRSGRRTGKRGRR